MDQSLKPFTDDELLEEALKARLKLGCTPKEEKRLRSAMNSLKKDFIIKNGMGYVAMSLIIDVAIFA